MGLCVNGFEFGVIRKQLLHFVNIVKFDNNKNAFSFVRFRNQDAVITAA